MSSPGAGRNALRTGAILFVFALVGTAMLAFTHARTEPTITRGQLAAKRALLSQVLPAALYDNDLLASQQSVPPDDLLGTRQPSALWLARRGGAFSGVVLEAIAPDGYSGDIALLIGIDANEFSTGAGIVADSIPGKEFEETGHKAQAMIHAVQGNGDEI